MATTALAAADVFVEAFATSAAAEAVGRKTLGATSRVSNAASSIGGLGVLAGRCAAPRKRGLRGTTGRDAINRTGRR